MRVVEDALLEPAPDYAEPLQAWRVWRVVERGGELTLASIVKGTLWPAREPLAAECLGYRPFRTRLLRRPRHEAPQAGCECGVYGTRLERAARYLVDTLPEARARLLGRVALWGTVVECEHGYRASRAYPLVLYVSEDAGAAGGLDGGALAAGLARYGVPIELVPAARRDLERLLGAAG
jgi:hypothetical protein